MGIYNGGDFGAAEAATSAATEAAAPAQAGGANNLAMLTGSLFGPAGAGAMGAGGAQGGMCGCMNKEKQEEEEKEKELSKKYPFSDSAFCGDDQNCIDQIEGYNKEQQNKRDAEMNAFKKAREEARPEDEKTAFKDVGNVLDGVKKKLPADAKNMSVSEIMQKYPDIANEAYGKLTEQFPALKALPPETALAMSGLGGQTLDELKARLPAQPGSTTPSGVPMSIGKKLAIGGGALAFAAAALIAINS